MAMATMALAAQIPPVTTVPPAVTDPTPTVTSPTPTPTPTPITENPNQPANRAVGPEIPEPSSPESDELEGGERDEGTDEGRMGTEEGKGEGVEKTEPENEEEKEEEELDGDDGKDVGDEDEHEDVADENEKKTDLENAGNVNMEEEEIVDERIEGEMEPKKKVEEEKGSKSVNRRLNMDKLMEAQTANQGAKRCSKRIAGQGNVKESNKKTVEISSGEEEVETPLKKKARDDQTDQEESEAPEDSKETKSTAAPESVTPEAVKNPPRTVDEEKEPQPEPEEKFHAEIAEDEVMP